MNSQTIEGVGSISGGEYERISIEGVGNSKGDITVKYLDIEGVFKSNGKIKAETIQCEGVAEFSDKIRANKMIIEGVMKFSKNANVEAEEIICDGCIKANEIYGEEIIIHTKPFMNRRVNSLLKSITDAFDWFVHSSKSASKADLIEATTITIHNTNVHQINGANITIGENCEVDHVDCTGTLRIHHSAIVKKITGVTAKYTE